MIKQFVSATLLVCLLNLPAQASTMPKADLNSSALAIGIGPSFSADFKLAPQVSLGASIGLPFHYFENFGITRYDIRVNYQFLRQGNLTLSGIFGLWGDANFLRRDKNLALSPLGLELGIGLAFQFTPQLTGRINVVPGFGFTPGALSYAGYFPPAGGFELAYKFTPTIEGTLGVNGNGDIIGIKFGI